MEKENKSALSRYLVCFGVAALITVCVFSIKGWFNTELVHNMSVLTDGFFASGALMMRVAGFQFVSGEGALLALGFVLGKAIRALIPFIKKPNENYQQYCERKANKEGKKGDGCIFFTGLTFLLVSFVFMGIWLSLQPSETAFSVISAIAC